MARHDLVGKTSRDLMVNHDLMARHGLIVSHEPVLKGELMAGDNMGGGV